MKVKSILAGISFIILFLIAVSILPKSGKTYYKYENYQRTIDTPISGTVKRLIEGKNFLGAQFGSDPNNYYRFTYHVERTPKQWLDTYPRDFILIGDSILKKASNDTFFVIRKSNVWTYILPRGSSDTK